MRHPLQRLRDYYLDCFAESIREAQERFDQFATELLLELPSLKYPEYCHRLYRADIMGERAGEPVMLEVSATQKEVTSWRKALPPNVSIGTPIVWYGIEFCVTDARPPEAELVAWALRWLDVSDSRYVASQLFQEVVHSITPPRAAEGAYEFSVDFGSASTAAFDEMVAIIACSGSKVVISSFSHVGDGNRQ